jgi:hypothetical protein
MFLACRGWLMPGFAGAHKKEQTGPKPEVNAEARKELPHLAALAGGADDLCSTFVPLFVEGYRQDTGGEPSQAVRWFAKQIGKLRAMGVHGSSSVIATLLRELANPEPEGSE